MTWKCSERGHHHDMYCNIETSNADGPLHSTNKRLILLDVVFTEKTRRSRFLDDRLIPKVIVNSVKEILQRVACSCLPSS
jgi:hypothetical protein